MDEAKQQAVAALRTQLDLIADYSSEVLAEGKDLGAINFQTGKPLFDQAISLAAEFRALPIDLLPFATIQQLQPPVQQLAKGLTQVAEFTLVGQQNPETQRNSLLEQAQSHYDKAFTAITPHLAYLSLKSAEVQETMRRSAELLADTQSTVNAALVDLEAKQEEINGIVRAARDAAATVGVAHFAPEFEKAAKNHLDASKDWLRGTILLAGLTVVVALLFVWVLPPIGELKDPATLQRIITKLVAISIFYFAAVWSSRNYRAHRHLAVVNSHRQNALATFETFVKAASDEPTKNTVLLEATRCIFSPSATGYLGADEEAGTNRIVEVLKTVGSSPSSG